MKLIIMLQKNTCILLLVFGILSSCAEPEKVNPVSEDTALSASDNVLNESENLLFLLKKNKLIMGGTKINDLVLSYNLKPENQNFRAEVSYGNISLKKVFKCFEGVVNTVHFDFYYDSINTSLEQDTKTILEVFKKELGGFGLTHKSSSMKTYTWEVLGNLIDLEVFKNGFTYTIRKNPTINLPVVIREKPLSEQIILADLLITYIYNDSISLGRSNVSSVPRLFNVAFKRKSNALAFSKVYGENKLLSGSFLFEDNLLSGIYFDYVYSDTTSKEFVSDAASIKAVISELFGPPSDIATVTLSTSYRWPNAPIVLEVYGDGFSVFLEKEML